MKKNVLNNHMLNKLLVLTVLSLFFSYLASGQTITDSVEKKDGDQPENKLVESDRELELMKQAELSKNDKPEEPLAYNENRLRRFEIISLTSIPFTAIHSFLAVRGVKMIQQNKFAPQISDKDYQVIGLCTVTSSILIGLWDLYNNRGKNTSELLIPEIDQSNPNQLSLLTHSGQPDEIDALNHQPAGILALVKIRF